MMSFSEKDTDFIEFLEIFCPSRFLIESVLKDDESMSYLDIVSDIRLVSLRILLLFGVLVSFFFTI